jgi:hypothetical protein
MRIATELIGEVVKRRKNTPSLLAPENEPEKFSDRSQEVSGPETNPENADLDAPGNQVSSHENRPN